MLFGTTYSHRHILKHKLDDSVALDTLLKMKLDVIRVCCYWDEVQFQDKDFDFTKMHNILDACEASGQKVLFAFGMKAPRWPEFYIPAWVVDQNRDNLSNVILPYIEKVVHTFKNYNCIYSWQVENEPLDPSGPGWKTVPYDLLKREVEVVRSIDARPVTVTMWGNELSKRNLFPKIAEIGDIVGLDIYYQQPTGNVLGRTVFRGPSDTNLVINEIVTQTTKPIWITELQAEPWGQKNQASESNKKFLELNYYKALELNAQAIFFWGYEYWYAKKCAGDNTMIETIQKFIKLHREHYPLT